MSFAKWGSGAFGGSVVLCEWGSWTSKRVYAMRTSRGEALCGFANVDKLSRCRRVILSRLLCYNGHGGWREKKIGLHMVCWPSWTRLWELKEREVRPDDSTMVAPMEEEETAFVDAG